MQLLIENLRAILAGKRYEAKLFSLHSRAEIIAIPLYKYNNACIEEMTADILNGAGKDRPFVCALILYNYIKKYDKMDFTRIDSINIITILLDEFDLSDHGDIMKNIFFVYIRYNSIIERVLAYSNAFRIDAIDEDTIVQELDWNISTIALFDYLKRSSQFDTMHSLFRKVYARHEYMHVHISYVYFEYVNKAAPPPKIRDFDTVYYPLAYVREYVTHTTAKIESPADKNHNWAACGIFSRPNDVYLRRIYRFVVHMRHCWRQTKNYRIKVILYECFGASASSMLDETTSPHEYAMAHYLAVYG